MNWAPSIVWLLTAVAGLVLGTAHVSAQGAIQTAAETSSWFEETWPFPIDQWGNGRAFDCAAERCGGEAHLYVRAKIGFCRCAPGVADDNEIERVGDLELFGPEYKALASGHPVSAGTMS